MTHYHFLQDYFLTLFIINNLVKKKVTDHFTNAIATYAEGSSTGYVDILKYFKSNDILDYALFINKYKRLYKANKTTQIERAISFLIHLIIDFQGQGVSQHELSKTTLIYFKEGNNTIKNLFIFGNTSPLDFSECNIEYSGFYDYTAFLTCNLDHTFFSYCTVEIELKDLNGINITRETFDTTCTIGSLGEYLLDSGDSGITDQSSNEVILRRFLRNFLNGNKYIEVESTSILFPREHLNTSSPFFREAIKQHVLYFSKDSSKCGVTTAGEKSVSNYLTNNSLDSRLFKILNRL